MLLYDTLKCHKHTHTLHAHTCTLKHTHHHTNTCTHTHAHTWISHVSSSDTYRTPIENEQFPLKGDFCIMKGAKVLYTIPKMGMTPNTYNEQICITSVFKTKSIGSWNSFFMHCMWNRKKGTLGCEWTWNVRSNKNLPNGPDLIHRPSDSVDREGGVPIPWSTGDKDIPPLRWEGSVRNAAGRLG